VQDGHVENQRAVDAHHEIGGLLCALDLPTETTGERDLRSGAHDALAPSQRNRCSGEAQWLAVCFLQSEVCEAERLLKQLVNVFSTVDEAGICGKTLKALCATV
jgi:hypothetical protein